MCNSSRSDRIVPFARNKSTQVELLQRVERRPRDELAAVGSHVVAPYLESALQRLSAMSLAHSALWKWSMEAEER